MQFRPPPLLLLLLLRRLLLLLLLFPLPPLKSCSGRTNWRYFFFPPQSERASESAVKRRNPGSCLCQRSSKVCREFQRGNCARGEMDCRFAHPSDSPMIDTADNTVTVCMDYIKSRCSREKCKYFHPPAHLQAKIKSSQQQISQTAAAGQTASVVRHYCPSVCVDVLGIFYLSICCN